VIVKAVVKPGRWLPKDIYGREVKTHKKSRLIIRLLEEKRIGVLIPFAALVEVAGVLVRLASRSLAEGVVESLRTTENYQVIYEDEIRGLAVNLALETGAGGFDTYFIAVAKLYDATLMTDDEPMAICAERVGVDAILVRRVDERELIAKLDELASG